MKPTTPPLIFSLAASLACAGCDAPPSECSEGVDTRAVITAREQMAAARSALINLRMNPTPYVESKIARPPEFEIDPAALEAVRALRRAEKDLALALRDCQGGSAPVAREEPP